MSLPKLKMDFNDSGHRKKPRYSVRWRVAIVYDNNGQNEIFHGHIHDLSMEGASLYSDHNIFVEEPVKVLLVIPSLSTNRGDKIIEIHSRMIYTVLAANHHQFRIGLHFLRFKADGRSLLNQNLSKRITVTAKSILENSDD